MQYTVKKLAELAGVSVRTLHYYDEIGLLKPSYVADTGYRYYQEKELLTLQQILFFRELGFPLKQIQEILTQGVLDRLATLASQKKLISTKIRRLQTLIKTIDTTIDHLEGKQAVHDRELFIGFEPDSREQYLYEKYVEEYLTKKYGNDMQQIMQQSYKDAKKWTKDDWQKARQEGDEICNALVMLMRKQKTLESQEVQQVVRRHYEWIKQFWAPTKETYAGHADFIMDTELRKFYDAYDPQLAQFIADAIKVFAERNL
ncbi:MAG: MerR family transcriptional regulator [Candidatus Babeliales bacterium]